MRILERRTAAVLRRMGPDRAVDLYYKVSFGRAFEYADSRKGPEGRTSKVDAIEGDPRLERRAQYAHMCSTIAFRIYHEENP